MTIAFDDHGSGPPLVLLHGIGRRRGAWDPVVGALARERRVIALDLPGFGASPPAEVEPTVPAVPALARTGAGRTALLAQIHARAWRLSQAEVVASVDALLGAPAFEPALAALSRYAFREPDALRGTPVTIAWGTRDALLIPRQAARARRLLPWARHVALPGCGHLPFHDDPQAVAAVLLAGSAG